MSAPPGPRPLPPAAPRSPLPGWAPSRDLPAKERGAENSSPTSPGGAASEPGDRLPPGETRRSPRPPLGQPQPWPLPLGAPWKSLREAVFCFWS